jgi:FkbM family methyltransferase
MKAAFRENAPLFQRVKKVGLYFDRFRPDRAVRMLMQRLSVQQLAVGTLVPLHINNGTTINVRARTTDIQIFEQIFLMRDCLPPEKIDPEFIIDGGAHIGCSAVYFAQAFPMAKIVAVEADRGNFELLKLNAAPFRNIECVHGAIWGSDEPVSLANPGDESWGYRVEALGGAGPAAIAGMTIDTLLANSGKKRIGLLKLDIEGAEAKVFSGPCGSWLKATDAIMIELHDRFQAGCTESFFSAIEPFGFEPTYRSEHNVTVVSPQTLRT